MLAPILKLTFYLIIAEHMLHLLRSNNKRSYLLIINSKNIKKTAIKHLSLYYVVTKRLKDNDLLIFSLLIITIYNCKNKYTNKKKTVQKRL